MLPLAWKKKSWKHYVENTNHYQNPPIKSPKTQLILLPLCKASLPQRDDPAVLPVTALSSRVRIPEWSGIVSASGVMCASQWQAHRTKVLNYLPPVMSNLDWFIRNTQQRGRLAILKSCWSGILRTLPGSERGPWFQCLAHRSCLINSYWLNVHEDESHQPWSESQGP